MDLMELGAIGELVGGVAVIGSLIYLALQVRQSNEHARQTLELERSQANREMSGHFAEVFGSLRDAGLMSLVRRAMSDWSALSRSEQGQVAAWVGALHIHTVSTFLARQQGLMDEDFADAWIDWYVSYLKTPGLTEWWSRTRPTHHPRFVTHIEERLLSPNSPSPVHTVLSWYEANGEA